MTRQEWETIGRQMGWKQGDAPRLVIVYNGESDTQLFWEAKGKIPHNALIRNKAENHWFAMIDGFVVMDKLKIQEAQKKNRASFGSMMTASNPSILADSLLEQEHILIVFDTGKMWKPKGKGFFLKPTEAAKT